MDAARSNRLYPSYTTNELKVTLATKVLDDAVRIKMQGEVDGRDAGISVYRPTPRFARRHRHPPHRAHVTTPLFPSSLPIRK